MLEFEQQDLIPHYVFPILTYTLNENGILKFDKFLGTGFFIGNKGYALTCTHIFGGNFDNLMAVFPLQERWWYFKIEKIEHHPNIDLSIIKIQNNWNSPFLISSEREFGSKDYNLVGYPEAVVNEIVSVEGIGVPRPDLIYNKGYIRRRYPRKLKINGIKGDSFYELSTISGWGCSGAPLYEPQLNKIWKLMGIYVAQKIVYTDERKKGDVMYIDYNVGYAITSDCFFDWKPKMLTSTIQDESKNYTP